MFKNLRSKKGFTLLELIVVVVVLGILAALAIPSFSTVKQSAADKVAIQSAESVVRNAEAQAAFEGASLSDTYVDAAGSETTGYDAGANTVTVTSGGKTAVATIDATTGAVAIQTTQAGIQPIAFNPTYSFGVNDIYGGSCNDFAGNFGGTNKDWYAFCLSGSMKTALATLQPGNQIRITFKGYPTNYDPIMVTVQSITSGSPFIISTTAAFPSQHGTGEPVLVEF